MRISDWSSDVCSSDLAYLAMTLVGQPQAGETVLVSTAAGAVGSAVGQIAKIYGCRTVGIAGGSEKAHRCIQEFGYDAAINYQGEEVSSEEHRHGKEGVSTCQSWCAEDHKKKNKRQD